MALTARVGIVAALGAAMALLLPASAWVLVGVNGGLFIGIVVDLVLAAPVRSLVLSRRGDTTARLGEPAAVTLAVMNTSRRPLRGVLRDAWAPSAGARPSRHRLDVPAGGRRWLSTELRSSRRGDVRPARVTVRSVGPLGLAGRQGSHEVPWSVRVLPPFGSRRLIGEKLARLREIDGRSAARVRGQGTEFDSLREYVAGDDVRSIDWRATARATSVVVRTWRPERDRRLVLVLDTGRTSAARVADIPRLDCALDAALLLAALASRAGDRIEALAGDQKLRAAVSATAGRDILPTLMNATALLEPALVETDMRMIVSEVLRRSSQRCLVVLFTALDAAPLAEGLLPVLGTLTTRHQVLLASVGDPALDDLAGGRGGAGQVYEAAAAAQALGERQRMTTLLRRRGVSVVDAPPDGFASAVADTYLSFKAAGRL